MKIAVLIASIIGSLLLMVYTILMAKKKGCPLFSLSETAYIAKSPNVFTFVIVVGAFLMTPQMIVNTSGWVGFLGIVFLFGMMMVGASPHYRTIGKALHMIGAFTAAISSQLLIGLTDYRFLVFWLIYGIIYLVRRKRSVLWEEGVCFTIITTFNILG